MEESPQSSPVAPENMKSEKARHADNNPLPKPVRIKHQAPVVAKHPEPIMSRKRPNVEPLASKAVKFMAAAEVVHHFHRDTPERFHSRPARSNLQSESFTHDTTINNSYPRSKDIKKLKYAPKTHN